ncbi:restriction endonuclease subunit S [Streptomyces montanisoli]|uniref:Restriction endonuclease subunit S n=1 Tax=Streptomyces montanisoli TaxID=2798581 RepID=A0A940RTS1_9ACTN|nr:restriction endonuclease subunit S [Streptomyces montanisoli]MBP0456471.1 restriction endonuclease subunit S [Streptomyces montanisoli]
MRADGSIQWVPVRDAGEVRMGKQLSPSGREGAGKLPYLRVANVHEGRIDYSDVKTMAFSAAEREVYGIHPGDILLNEGQESLRMVGRSALYDGPVDSYCFQNTLIRFRPRPEVLPQYAQMVFVQWRLQGVFAAVAEKTSISHLGGNRFAALPFPVRPLAEQRRIIEVIGAVAAQERAIEASIAKLDKVWNGSVAELQDVECGTLEGILRSGPQNGLYKPATSYGPQGTPIVRIDSFDGGPSDFTRNLLRVSLNGGEIDRYGLALGDIVINRVNTPELVGKSTAVSGLAEPTVFESNMMRCRVNVEFAVPEFVETWLGSALAKAHFRQRAKSAISQASINGSDVRTCPFPRLSIAGQSAFVARLAILRSRQRSEEVELVKLASIRRGIVDDLLS